MAVLLCCVAEGWVVPAAWARMEAGSLRTEYGENPVGIDVAQPRLSWKVIADENARGVRQTAYRILVASDEGRLKRNDGDLWDSGRVESSETVNLPYGGRELASSDASF